MVMISFRSADDTSCGIAENGGVMHLPSLTALVALSARPRVRVAVSWVPERNGRSRIW